MTGWSTACLDWSERIAAGRSIIPALPVDEKRAEKALRIFKRLKVVDIPGQPTLGQCCADWVFDLVRVVFGMFDVEARRQLIREFMILVSKKNAKSTIAAGIMLTALIMNERAQGEYLILAPTKDVADNSFLPAYGMVKADPALFARYKPSDATREIVNRLDGSILTVKSADADVVGGQKAISIFVDELWLFGKKASAENILSEATGSHASRPEGFAIYATTQSDEPPAGVFRKKLAYHRDVRDGKIDDPRSLPVLYEYPEAMQKAETWRDPTTWHIPNPSLGRSVDHEWLRSELPKKEQEGLDSLRLFVAKHFNVEIGLGYRSDRWPGAEFWQRQADEKITFETLLDRCEVIICGLDGGGLDDLYGLTLLGRDKATKDWLWWSHAWCHRGVLDRRKSIASRLQDFASGENPDLTIVDDELDDIAQMVEIIGEVKDRGLLGMVAADPAGLGEMVEALAAIDITQENGLLEGVAQGYSLMNAIKTAERKLANGTLRHAPSPMMNWCVGNLKIEPTATAIRATKQNAGDAKIDPVMAGFNAVTIMVKNPEAINRSVFDLLGEEGMHLPAEDPQSDDVDMAILADPRHPRWAEMRERYDRRLPADEDYF